MYSVQFITHFTILHSASGEILPYLHMPYIHKHKKTLSSSPWDSYKNQHLHGCSVSLTPQLSEKKKPDMIN